MLRDQGDLVGRVDEMAMLLPLLERAGGGADELVAISGEAGIGKSRLLAELERHALDARWLVLSGRSAEFADDPPFGVIVDAYDAYLRTLGEREINRLALDRLGALSEIFPSLSSLGRAIDHPMTSADRFRVHRAVVELTERLAARQPVLIILDDLQWADVASLEVVSQFERRPPQAAVMLAMGIRAAASMEKSRRAISQILRSERITSMKLEPLDRESVRQLVAFNHETELDRLFRLSGGNPFYALQLARFGTSDAADHRVADAVPDAVLNAIDGELAHLSQDARDIASAAAVVGDPFDVDLTVAAAARTEDEVLDGLDELCDHDIVRPDSSPRRFHFRHPLVRRAIYQSSRPGRRIARHRRIAHHLSQRGALPVELAQHLVHSARHGDLEAVDVLERAGRGAIATAPHSAARWLAHAIDLLPVSEPAVRRIGLLGLLARARGAVGDVAGGMVALEQSLAVVPVEYPRVRVTVAIACANGERMLGSPQRADQRLRHEYQLVADADSSEAGRLCVALASNGIYLNDRDAMLRWALEATRIAELRRDGTLLVASEAVQTTAAAFVGKIGLALESHREVGAQIDGLSDSAVADHLDVLTSFSAAEMYLDFYRSGLTHAQRGLALARSSGFMHLMPLLSPTAGTCAWMLGEVELSETILDDAIESARLIDDSPSLSWHLFNRAYGALMQGDLGTANSLSAESFELSRSLDAGTIAVWSAACRAHVVHELGRPAEAVELLVKRAGGDELTSIAGGWRGVYLELLARCHLQLGDRERAIATGHRCRQLASDVPLGIAAMAADRVDSLVALELDSTGAAVEHARSAIEAARSIDSPVHIATSQTLLGRALLADGHEADATVQLEAAAGGYHSLGAVRYRNEVEALLRQLGKTIHRRSRPGDQHGSGIATLTGRELEVAELVRDRHTNREIAEDLFLSLKTVETHIRNIFNKLGVSSRTDIARLVDIHHAAR